jgi:hypothetical protein
MGDFRRLESLLATEEAPISVSVLCRRLAMKPGIGQKRSEPKQKTTCLRQVSVMRSI